MLTTSGVIKTGEFASFYKPFQTSHVILNVSIKFNKWPESAKWEQRPFVIFVLVRVFNQTEWFSRRKFCLPCIISRIVNIILLDPSYQIKEPMRGLPKSHGFDGDFMALLVNHGLMMKFLENPPRVRFVILS